MKRTLFLFFLLSQMCFAKAQKITMEPMIYFNFIGSAQAKGIDSKELKPHVPKLSITPGIKIDLHSKHLIHSITFQQAPIGISFQIYNKYQLPPYDSLRGFGIATHSNELANLLMGYSLQLDHPSPIPVNRKLNLQLRSSVGLGIAFNRNKGVYSETFSHWQNGASDPYSFIYYSYDISRMGVGYFLKLNAGIVFMSKKKSKIFSLNIYYNKGFKTMTTFKLLYTYGYHNDPSKTVYKENIILRNRGTLWGFNLGFPITLKK